jgi:hypothetical protein
VLKKGGMFVRAPSRTNRKKEQQQHLKGTSAVSMSSTLK